MHVSEGELKEFITDSGLVAQKRLMPPPRKSEARAVARRHACLARLSDRGRAEAHPDIRPRHTFVNLKGASYPDRCARTHSEPIARTHNIVAYKKERDSLEVAMLDVGDLASIDSVRKKTGLKILPRLTDTESIKSTLLQYQSR